MQQTIKISDYTAFLCWERQLFNDTETLFIELNNKKTEDYITGRFG